MSRRALLLDRIRPALVCPNHDAFRFAGLRQEAQNADWLHTIASGFAIEVTTPGGAPAR